MDRITDGKTSICCAWAGRTFFQEVLLCHFLVLVGNRFSFSILMYLENNTVVVLCQFFGSGRKQFLVLRTYLVYNTVVWLCQFFHCGGKWFSKWEHVSTEKSYWVTLLWSNSRCVYFISPNTLLLCIFLFCIFLLYREDQQVEVQIRILLKEAAIVSKIRTPALTLWFPKHRSKENFYLGFFIKEK